MAKYLFYACAQGIVIGRVCVCVCVSKTGSNKLDEILIVGEYLKMTNSRLCSVQKVFDE